MMYDWRGCRVVAMLYQYGLGGIQVQESRRLGPYRLRNLTEVWLDTLALYQAHSLAHHTCNNHILMQADHGPPFHQD